MVTLVVRHAHRTIALVVGYAGSVRAVDWDVEIVGSQPVSMRVRIREETALKNNTQHCNILPPVGGTNMQRGWMTKTWGEEQASWSPAASCQDLAQCLVACCWGQRPSAPPLQSSWLGSCWESFCPLGSEGTPYETKPKRQYFQTCKNIPFSSQYAARD